MATPETLTSGSIRMLCSVILHDIGFCIVCRVRWKRNSGTSFCNEQHRPVSWLSSLCICQRKHTRQTSFSFFFFCARIDFRLFAISFFQSEESDQDRIKRCTSKTEMVRTVPDRSNCSNTRDFHTKTDSNGKKVKWGNYSCTCSLLTPRMDLCSTLKRERPEKYCCLSDIHQSTDTLVVRCSHFLGHRQPINELSGKQIIWWFVCLIIGCLWPRISEYRKTPLISTYVFSGLATV